jgi:hypothetical protein
MSDKYRYLRICGAAALPLLFRVELPCDMLSDLLQVCMQPPPPSLSRRRRLVLTVQSLKGCGVCRVRTGSALHAA